MTASTSPASVRFRRTRAVSPIRRGLARVERPAYAWRGGRALWPGAAVAGGIPARTLAGGASAACVDGQAPYTASPLPHAMTAHALLDPVPEALRLERADTGHNRLVSVRGEL